jgi:cytoskeletal protein CcmA (bactofilin family)
MADSSLIGAGTSIRGNIHGSGSLEVFGRVDGDITIDGDVSVGNQAVIHGRVSGARVTVSGSVQGDLHGTEAVLIEQGARVVGDLLAPRVGIENGALVRGHVRTEGDISIEAPPPRPPAAQSAAATRARSAKTAKAIEAEMGVMPVAKDAAPEPPRAPQVAAPRRPPAPVVPTLGKGARARKRTHK